MKKVLFLVKGIDDLYQGRGFVGGLTVQMSIWMQTFVNKGWRTFSLTNNRSQAFKGVYFIKMPYFKKISMVVDFLYMAIILFRVRPQLVFVRGATRNLFIAAFWMRFFNFKLVHFGASDSDYSYEDELIAQKRDRFIYRWGLKYTDYFIAQNLCQQNLLVNTYHKTKVLIIPNVWETCCLGSTERNIILWVGNFRNLKRPHWFVDLAKSFPKEHFVMIGAPIDMELYNSVSDVCSHLSNIDFLGPKSFFEVNKVFNKAKLFVCTSEVEGFPNTFLQSWANSIPVLTTFDPSNIVQNKCLGYYSKELNGLKSGLSQLLSDDKFYKECQSNIKDYFINHNPDIQYEKLMFFLNSK